MAEAIQHKVRHAQANVVKSRQDAVTDVENAMKVLLLELRERPEWRIAVWHVEQALQTI